MATEIRMPRLSQTTDDVKLVSWLVKEGDTVKRGDPLCEVETDKAAMPVESYESGTVLKILGVPDTVIAAGTPIAILGTPGEKASLAESGAPGEEASPADSAAPAKAPVEKASAASTGTPAGAAAGSLRKPDRPPPAAGPVKATSLVRNVASKLGIDLAGVMGTGPGGLITKKDLEDFRGGGLKAVSLSKNQMVVSRSVARSKREAPHYYLKTTVLMDRAR